MLCPKCDWRVKTWKSNLKQHNIEMKCVWITDNSHENWNLNDDNNKEERVCRQILCMARWRWSLTVCWWSRWCKPRSLLKLAKIIIICSTHKSSIIIYNLSIPSTDDVLLLLDRAIFSSSESEYSAEDFSLKDAMIWHAWMAWHDFDSLTLLTFFILETGA